MDFEMVLATVKAIVAVGAAIGMLYGGSRFVAIRTLRGELRPEIEQLVSKSIDTKMGEVMGQIREIKDGEAACHSTVMDAIMKTAEMQRIRDEEQHKILDSLSKDMETLEGIQRSQTTRIDELHNLVTRLAIKT